MFTAREDSGKPAGMKPVVKPLVKVSPKQIKKVLLPQEKFAKQSDAY